MQSGHGSDTYKINKNDRRLPRNQAPGKRSQEVPDTQKAGEKNFRAWTRLVLARWTSDDAPLPTSVFPLDTYLHLLLQFLRGLKLNLSEVHRLCQPKLAKGRRPPTLVLPVVGFKLLNVPNPELPKSSRRRAGARIHNATR